MKTQTIYIEVLCSEKFPKKGEQVVAIFENSDIQDGYFTDFRIGDEYICKDGITFFSKESGEQTHLLTQPEPIMWLEKLEEQVVMSKSEYLELIEYLELMSNKF